MGAIELFSYADAHPTGAVEPLYRELAEQAVLADQLGYPRLWLTEQHLSAPGRVPDSLQMLAFLAARTHRLRLGTGVLPAAVHDPVLLLESALQLDAVSGGRLDLGVGSGSEAGTILEALGIAPRDTGELTRRLYELMSETRPGHRLRHPAGSTDAELVLDPAPARPLLEHVWTAAGRNALELAGRYRTGLLLPRPMPLGARRDLAAAYRAAVPDPRVVHFKAGLVAPTAEEARRRAAPFVQAYARRYLNLPVGGPDTTDFAAVIDALDFAVGTPDDVLDHMRAWLDPFDQRDVIAIQFAGPGVQQQHVLESLELLAPHLADLDLGSTGAPRAGSVPG